MPDAPVEGRRDAGDINSEVYFEPGIPPAVIEALRGMGILCLFWNTPFNTW